MNKQQLLAALEDAKGLRCNADCHWPNGLDKAIALARQLYEPDHPVYRYVAERRMNAAGEITHERIRYINEPQATHTPEPCGEAVTDAPRKCMICGYGRYCNNCVVNGDNHAAMFPISPPPADEATQ